MSNKLKFYSKYIFLAVATNAIIMFICYLTNDYSINPEDYKIPSKLCFLLIAFQMVSVLNPKIIPEKILKNPKLLQVAKLFGKVNAYIFWITAIFGIIVALSVLISAVIVVQGISWEILSPTYKIEIFYILVLVIFLAFTCLISNYLDR